LWGKVAKVIKVVEVVEVAKVAKALIMNKKMGGIPPSMLLNT
jgi:hypothetical protein